MSKKLPIDKQRESAGTLMVGDDDDNSAIKELLSTTDALYAIKEKGVYKIRLADDIDPDRTNLNIPNLSQKVLSAGYDNEIVARILLTAKYLFDENNATVRPFIGNLFEGSLDLVKHVLELQEMISSLKDKISQKENIILQEKQKTNAFSLPSIPDLNTKLHNIFVRADKAKDGILSLYKLHLLPNADKKPKLSEYDNAIRKLPNIEPDFVSSWNESKKFFILIRNIRNSSEHPKNKQQVILSDFNMNSDGSINPPLVEIQHKDTLISLLPLVELLDFLQERIINYAEGTLVFIRCLVLLDNNPFGQWVSVFPVEERRHPFVKYYRSINIGGTERILG